MPGVGGPFGSTTRAGGSVSEQSSAGGLEGVNMEAQQPLPQSAAKDLMAHLEEMKQQLLQSHPGLPSLTVARTHSWGQHSQTNNQGINPKTEPLNYPAVSTVPMQKLPCPCAAPGLAAVGDCADGAGSRAACASGRRAGLRAGGYPRCQWRTDVGRP